MFPSTSQKVDRDQSQDDSLVEDALVLRMEAEIMAEAEWDETEERVSFADSERFDDDDELQCSTQNSESGSLGRNWQGWSGAANNTFRGEGDEEDVQVFISGESMLNQHGRQPFAASEANNKGSTSAIRQISSLADLAARKVASALSFELIEFTYASLPLTQRAHQGEHLPENLVIPILRQCFPESTENIRLYSCLTNCGDRLFALGEQLFLNGAVSECYQIGYHLSAMVNERHLSPAVESGVRNFDVSAQNRRTYNVCIRVDRCRIVSCSCSCANSSFWCQHVVAASLQRIQRPNTVQYRPAIWDSITALKDNDLKKLAQYLINELPREYIPIAQKLIDALKDHSSEINRTQGAPDPTAGLAQNTPAVWYMDALALRDEVRKMLLEFLRKSSALSVVCEFQSLLISPPALAHEWNTFQRTFCARQPESIWNLLGMVRVMLQRMDSNAPALLHIITEQCLALDMVLLRWYQMSLSASGHWHLVAASASNQRGIAQQNHSRQLNIHLLCQELANLWRMVALNPRLSPNERDCLSALLQLYQRTCVARIFAILGKSLNTENNSSCHVVDSRGHRLFQQNAPFSRKFFPAFFLALHACRRSVWSRQEAQQLIEGTRLYADIQLAHRQGQSAGNAIPNCPNLPFLNELMADERVNLLEMVEIEQQFGGISRLDLNSDVVVLPSKQSRRRKKRRKNAKRKKTSTGEKAKKGGVEAEKNSSREEEEGDKGKKQQQLMMSDGSSDEEAEEDIAEGKCCTSSKLSDAKKRREPFEDALDDLFAEAHADLDDEEHPFQMRFTCCETLLFHGYFREALSISDQLAADIIANAPDLLTTGHIAGGRSEQRRQFAATADESTTLESLSGGDNGTVEESGAEEYKCKNQSPPLLSSSSGPSSQSQHNHFSRHQSPPSFRRLARSHPQLIEPSLRARDALAQTLFLAKLLLLGEEFVRRNQTQRQKADAQLDAKSLPKCGYYRLLALHLALNTLRNPRGPAGTKMLEMEINYLEGKLFSLLLRRIELCPEGLNIVREIANECLQRETYSQREIVAIPSYRVVHYIVKALSNCAQEGTMEQPPCQPVVGGHRMPADEERAFELALQVLRMEVHISETEHPLMCESIRRLQKDLQMVLLTRNKDTAQKLGRVLETVLEPKVHRLYEEHGRSNVDFFIPNAGQALPNSLKIAGGQFHNRPSPLVVRPLPAPSSSSGSSPGISPFQPIVEKLGKRDLRAVGYPLEGQSTHQLNEYILLQKSASQSSESQAHHLFEFAKCLLQEAGGNHQNSPIFNAVIADAGGAGAFPAGAPNRNLHICSLLIALYALGLNNSCSPSWNTRTYSTHVSWIQAQALDIGRQALEIIRRTWRKHLTPTEVAALADKASQSNDPAVVDEAALLALSVLPEASSLLPAESQKALNQCKERGPKLLEEACLAVEKAAERGGVYPEVLFRVAHHWYDDLYSTHLEQQDTAAGPASSSSALVPHHHFASQQLQHQWSVPYHFHQTQMQQTNHYPRPAAPQCCPGQMQPLLYTPLMGPPPQIVGQQMLPVQPMAPFLYSPSVPPPPPTMLGRSIPPASAATIRLQTSHSVPNIVLQQQQQIASPLLPAQLAAHCSYYFAGQQPADNSAMLPAQYAQQQPPQPLACAMVQPPQPLIQQQHHLHRPQSQQPQMSQQCWPKRAQRVRSERTMQFLKNAHRCGIAAMNSLRSTEASSKFAKTPPSSDEICWLMEVSMEVGELDYVRVFCEKAFVCVYSPFVLLQLLRSAFKFFQHFPGANRVLGSEEVFSLVLQMANSQQTKACLQQAKSAIALHPIAGPLEELILHTILCCFNAASHKLSYSNFSASDQEYVCELAIAARDIFRLLPPYHHHHEHGKRKYMDYLLEHMHEQKAFKNKKNGGLAAVKGALQRQPEY